ncbi:MAG TPA: head GIN domain-containing protein [Bacteroidales bacterium]|nr:head GIN domain-containing protein [Bacteroidales bacterium]
MKIQSIITSVLIVLAAMLMNSCEDIGFGCKRGNGDLTTEDRVVSDFNGVEVNGSFTVYVDSSNETSVLVEADENLLDEIRTQVRGNNLIIETYRDRCLNSNNGITIYVTTPDIEEVVLRGSGRIYCDYFETSELQVDLSGSGSIFLDYVHSNESDFDLSGSGTIRGTIDTYSADIVVDGSGVIRLDGSAHHTNMDLTGSGSILAREFYTDNADVDLTGSGSVEVYATDYLEVRLTGSGIVYYYGNPVDVVKEITGSGSVIKR